jgi:hypothetical protein
VLEFERREQIIVRTRVDPRLHYTSVLLSSTQNVHLGQDVAPLFDAPRFGEETADRHVSELITYDIREEGSSI